MIIPSHRILLDRTRDKSNLRSEKVFALSAWNGWMGGIHTH
ncbi:hypothetical protein [Vacuolonema iberomarrocanum]